MKVRSVLRYGEYENTKNQILLNLLLNEIVKQQNYVRKHIFVS